MTFYARLKYACCCAAMVCAFATLALGLLCILAMIGEVLGHYLGPWLLLGVAHG
ncbi:hypothetical protein [Pseudomonas typographi]|uniref:Uncharacterized protein n=1 Tax=Pseudomonas typographi TaxID=2715964 RepID=A0ABR7Z638_9PSED|nr:hypothetical protein [Pseudomonas typographi]MBD1600884.1 hypothetical protein [Pseudomonas typographi]